MRRFHLLFIITLLISVNAYAQLNKKIWLVGGNGSFQSFTQDYILPPPGERWTYTQIESSAKVGYFIIDKLILGITPTYSYIDIENSDNTIYQKMNGFSIGPFTRYYFLDKYKPFNILTELNYQIGILSRGKSTKRKSTTNNFSFLVGPEIFINPSVGIEVLLGYMAVKETRDSSDNPYTYSYKGFQVAVGLQIHLENFNKK